MSEIQRIQERKIRERMEDRKRLERGDVTRDELQWKNSIIPREQAESPEWKKATLEAAIRTFTKPRSTLTVPPVTRHSP